MALSVDKFDRIQNLWLACLAEFDNDREAIHNKPFNVAVPDDLQERGKFGNRLLQLLTTGFYTMEVSGEEKGERIKVVQPKMVFQIPGQPSVHLNDSDIQGIVDAVARTFPHPEDPRFTDVINARVHGVVELLALMVRFHSQGRDAGETLRNALYLGMDAKERRPEGVLAVPLSSLDYERRAQELTSRRQIIELNLKAAVEGPRLREENRSLFEAGREKCSAFEMATKLLVLDKQLQTLAIKFNLHPYAKMKLWNMVLCGVRDLEPSNPQELSALNTLGDEVGLAETQQALQAAVSKFTAAIKRTGNGRGQGS